MGNALLWGAGIVVLLVGLDRLLLRLEARGWINYRRRGLSRGASGYHALMLQSVFDPSARHIHTVTYQETVQRNDSGAPPGSDPPRPPDQPAAEP